MPTTVAAAAAAAAFARELALLQDGPHRRDSSPWADEDQRRRGGRERERGGRDVDKCTRCTQEVAFALPRALCDGVAAKAGEEVRADAREASIDITRLMVFKC